MTKEEMKLRDRFAEKAMHALLTRPIAELAQGAYSESNMTVRIYVSEAAYKIADTMMEVRANKGGTPIKETSLPISLAHALKQVGIETIEQLADCTPRELLSIKNIGPKSLRDIEEFLASMGRMLKEDK